jgi:hypothetical protein
MGEQFEFDTVNEQAWSGFRARLADHLAEMEDDDILVVDTDPADQVVGGAAPYVQFCAWGETCMRAEVVSNAYLAAAHRMDEAEVEAVTGIGWHAPTRERDDEPDSGSENFFLDLERVEADRLAVMAVRVLREVFGVVHPAFLRADGLEDDPSLAVPAERDGTPPVADEQIATMPRDGDELQAMVDDALTPYFGHPPKKDADGDIPVVTDTTVVYVRVLAEAPIVHLFCRVVREVADVDAARFETGVLNRDGRFVRFSVVHDAVMAEIDLPALPFVPEHLRDLLGVLCSRADAVVDDLVERVGGRRELEQMDGAGDEEDDSDGAEPASAELLADLDDDDEDADDVDDCGVDADTDAVHPAMRTILELDADRPGSVTPEMAASVCSWDRDLVLELITWNGGQELAWRRARDRAMACDDGAEAEVCEAEREHAETSVTLLRRALRLVVEAQLARHRVNPGYVAGRSAPQRGRGGDSPLPGLEPRQDPGLFEARPSWLDGGRG